jgi:hypothetical protein
MDRPLNPYAPPAASLDPEGGATEAPPGFRPLSPLAQVLSVIFVAMALVSVASAASSAATAGVMERVLSHSEVSAAEIKGTDLRAVLLAGADAIAALAGVVVFCFFMARANRNARALRPDARMEFSPRWSAGVFFVPIVNLYKPYQAMKEIWQASQRDDDPQVPWNASDVPGLVGWWWGAYLASTIAGAVSSSFARDAHDPAAVITSAWISVVSDSLTVVSALLALLLVRQLARLQDGRSPTRAS